MAKRPAFFIGNDLNNEFVRIEEFDFNWYPGFSFTQKQKNVAEFHLSIHNKYPNYKILEISSKSNERCGRDLSAFKLSFKYNNKLVSVESAFQSSKVFESGEQYQDLLERSSKEAKTDLRIKNGGKLKKFHFNNEDWELTPPTSFYDWLYINALNESHNRELAKHIMRYDCFTDIEFNPKKSFNCQARSAALYKYLVKYNLFEKSLSKDNYLKLITHTFKMSKIIGNNMIQGSLLTMKKL